LAYADAQSGAVILDGDGEATIILAGTVTKGDLVGYSSGWVRALATTAGVIQARCVAGEDGVSGQRIAAYFDYAVIGGARFSGATAGGALYAAEATSVGKYTQTAPSDSGDSTKIVGYMMSATVAFVTPGYVNDSTV